MATAVTPEAVEKVVFDALPQFGADPSEITPRGDLRGPRRRLARPRRAVADHRGRVRRPAQGRRRRQDQDRRRRRRPGGEPRGMKRESSSPASAPSPRSGSAPARLHERWTAGTSGIEDGEGACTEFEPTEHLSVKEVRRADRFTQFALVASDEALAEAGWDGELPYDPKRIGCIIGTGIGGIGTLTHNHQVLLEEGAEEGLAALDPADDGQRRRGRRDACATSCAGPSFAPLSACAAGAHAIGEAVELIELGPRRRRRRRRLRGRARAARPRRLRRARRDVGHRHLAPVRRPPRRLRDGRGRRGARARGRREGARARRQHPRLRARLRRHVGRLPPDRARQGRRGRRRGDAHRARRRRPARPRTSCTSTRTAPRPRSTTAPRR